MPETKVTAEQLVSGPCFAVLTSYVAKAKSALEGVKA